MQEIRYGSRTGHKTRRGRVSKALTNEIKAAKYTSENEAGAMKKLIEAKVDQAATIIQNAVEVASDKKEKNGR